MSSEDYSLQVLKVHNEYRSKHGSPPLTLNKDLCKKSQEWAEHCLKNSSIDHRPDNEYGENIYTYYNSDKSEPTPEKAVGSWYGEIKKYKYGTAKHPEGTGHFTQVVWKGSKEIGVGKATDGNGRTYVVVNYNPAGNYKNEYKDNVVKPLKQ